MDKRSEDDSWVRFVVTVSKETGPADERLLHLGAQHFEPFSLLSSCRDRLPACVARRQVAVQVVHSKAIVHAHLTPESSRTRKWLRLNCMARQHGFASSACEKVDDVTSDDVLEVDRSAILHVVVPGVVDVYDAGEDCNRRERKELAD